MTQITSSYKGAELVEVGTQIGNSSFSITPPEGCRVRLLSVTNESFVFAKFFAEIGGQTILEGKLNEEQKSLFFGVGFERGEKVDFDMRRFSTFDFTLHYEIQKV